MTSRLRKLLVGGVATAVGVGFTSYLMLNDNTNKGVNIISKVIPIIYNIRSLLDNDGAY